MSGGGGGGGGGVEMRYRNKCDSQWQQLLVAHSVDEPPHCRPMTGSLADLYTLLKKYPTGSQYAGTFNVMGMAGNGVYTLPNGVIYEGELSDGEFHGEGSLQYSDGTLMRGVWRRGELVERTLFFNDACQYAEENWTYCTMPDRRFTIEYAVGLQPAGRSLMSARQPPPVLPPGCYDTADGYYDPHIKMVRDYGNPLEILRCPSKREQEWIMANCRRNDTEPCGPRRDLYEEWVQVETLGDTSCLHCPCQL